MQEDNQNKELLQAIVDASNLGLAVYKAVRNDKGEIVDFVHEFINRTTLEALGQDFTGRLLSARSADGIKQMELLKKVIESQVPNEYILQPEPGVVTGWFRFSNAPIGNDRLLQTWQDITEQKREELENIRRKEIERAKAEEALRESEQRLKGSLRLRDEFIGVASHELKTPVTSIKTYGEIVAANLKKSGDLKNAQLAGRLNVQVDRLTNLIDNLLDTTRIEAGKLSYQMELFSLNDLLKERIEEMQYIAGGRNLRLQLEEPSIVLADKERIGQVIVNLVSNAIKYTPNNTEVTIASSFANGQIAVSVADRGMGIPAESLNKIFDRFYRVGSPPMSTYPGMGLGLYISAQIIGNHGGTISVSSKEGEGSIFHFTLPSNR